jgi:hypothetical protein
MGMGYRDVELLLRLRKEGHFQKPGRIIEIGAQQASDRLLDASADLSARLSETFGVALDKWPLSGRSPSAASPEGHYQQPQDAPATRMLWEWLGFEYAAIDVDGSPRAIPVDLNYDPAPRRWKGRFALATNYGTTEHVCNQLNAFKVIHDLVAVDGIMIHNVPAQGMFCHGLVNYNMKFFWMLARSNGYKWLYGGFVQGARIDVHADVVDNVKGFDPTILSRRPDAYAEGSIMVALQKTYRRAFVAPLDVPNDSKAPNKEIDRRYWTVFHPDKAFGRWARMTNLSPSSLLRQLAARRRRAG